MLHWPPRFRARTLAIAIAALPAGCAHYTPAPLPSAPPLAPAIGSLKPGDPRYGAAGLPAGPLTVGDVVALALANNPDLKATRLRAAVAAAQLRQAGILPNPSLTGAFLPLISGVGNVPAWNVGLSQNIKAIVTYRSRVRAAKDSAGQVSADVIWQEWQVAGRARQLAADLIVAANTRPSYVAAYRLLAERNAKLERALQARTVTLTLVAPDRVALQAARAALDAFDQRQLAAMHQLDALLGLAPDTVIPLATTPDLPAFDPAAIRAGLPNLAQRRPDLLALRLGYAAADENVREAILAQFPDLVLGGSGASDNAQVINAGPNVQIGLPVFDRNQGNIAITRATRAQLNAEYAARLAATTGEAGALLTEFEQLARQLAVAKADLPATISAAQRAQAAFGASNIDERGYVDLVYQRFSKEQEIMTLELALLDRQIALETLVGAGLPTVDLPPEPATGGAR